MDIVFVRHGKTEINKRGGYCGWNESYMAPEGIEEIENLRKHIDISMFDGIYVSPFNRTIQTANILTQDNHIVDDRLKEINFGKFEGLNYKKAYELYPRESKMWEEDYVNYRLPDGESLHDVIQRTKSFIEEVSSKHQRVLAITHGGIIKCALSLVFDSYEHFYKFKVDHGSVSIISISDGYKFIKAVNCYKNIQEIVG